VIAATVCPSDVPSCAGLLDINLTLVVELVIFLLTCYILWRLVWRPIIEVLERRDQQLAAGQHAAAEAARRYEEGLAEVQAILERARTEARDIVADAYRSANAAAEQARAAAHAQARAITGAALAEIRAEMDAAVASLRSQAETLAVIAASRLLHTDLDTKRFARVAAEAVAE
jgi:F-type H+-transporting ATPase subunit b